MGQIKSAMAWKCPRCGQGDLFESKNPYQMGKMMEMRRNCNVCDLRYEKESGFFYGAMYVSYMLNIALFVTATIAWYMFVEDRIDWRLYIGAYVVITLMLWPVIYRYSRAIWIMWFVKHEPEKRGER